MAQARHDYVQHSYDRWLSMDTIKIKKEMRWMISSVSYFAVGILQQLLNTNHRSHLILNIVRIHLVF